MAAAKLPRWHRVNYNAVAQAAGAVRSNILTFETRFKAAARTSSAGCRKQHRANRPGEEAWIGGVVEEDG